MRLSKRIYTIADKIDRGETVADIGTDHGYVPMILIRDGISPSAVMSDISGDSLSKAALTFRLTGLACDPGDFRVGDGLDTIRPGEVDAVIIAGLGGHTITEILSADIGKSRSYGKLVLQPRKHSGALRYFLYTHGWDIIDEDLAREGKFACEIITAAPSPSGITSREAPYPADDIRWKYPENAWHRTPELASERIGWKISSMRGEIESLRCSSADRSALMADLSRDIAYLQELLTQLSE